MSIFRNSVCAIALSIMTIGGAQAGSLSSEQKVLLQTAMYQHIEANLTDDVITHVDLDTGNVVELVPTKAHPMILAFDDNYVLCADFIDPDGKEIDVDFYVKPSGENFHVFRMEIGNRKPLKKLMKEGRIRRIK